MCTPTIIVALPHMRTSALWLQLREVWERYSNDTSLFCLHVPPGGSEPQPWTWKHVYSAVIAVQSALQPLIEQQRPHVAIITHAGLEHSIAMLACLASGCDIVWIYPCKRLHTAYSSTQGCLCAARPYMAFSQGATRTPPRHCLRSAHWQRVQVRHYQHKHQYHGNTMHPQCTYMRALHPHGKRYNSRSLVAT